MLAATIENRMQKGAEETQVSERGATNLQKINVGEAERWASLAGGAALGVYGLTRGQLGGLALAVAGGALMYRGLSGQCPLYCALGVSTADAHGPATSIPAGHGVKVEESITIMRPAHELYRFWRNFENLPRIMRHLESVSCGGGGRSHWVAKGPLGLRVEWDAAIISERDDELIGWRSLPGSEVDTAGSVHFTPAPGNRGTKVRVTLKYDPPAGRVGAMIAKLFGRSPEQEIREDLHRFKQWMETGAVVAEGQSRERCQ